MRGLNSPMIVVYGFMGVAVAGTLLLLLPISSRSGVFTPFITALFTATSAISVTGLAVVPTGDYWSAFGQGVIFSLILVGGLGFMTSVAFLLIVARQRLGLQTQLAIREGLGVEQLGGLIALVRNIVVAGIVIEVIGTLALFLHWRVFGSLWAGISAPEALWQSAFHAVSAFNNAGFDILPSAYGSGASFTMFRGDYVVLSIIGVLIILGGLSYTVLHDLFTTRSLTKLRLESKLVLVGTVALLVGGMVMVYGIESHRAGTLGPRSPADRAVDALFASVTSRTAGFSTLDWGKTSPQTDLGMEALMFIGGVSGSTAGGVKVGTVAIILLTVLATIQKKRTVQVLGREVPEDVVRQAMVVGAMAAAAVFLITFLMVAVDNLPFPELLFESISALGTVGLSTGITSQITDWGRFVLVVAMFLGRFGPITLALLMQGRADEDPYRFAEERIRIG